MQDLQPVDLLAIAILIVAGLRGLFNGMIREVFSILALGAAVIAVQVWNGPFSEWLYPFVEGQISSSTVPWVSGALIGIGVAIAVGVFGSVMSRGARAAGLGLVDRAGGAALGVAEGALVVGVLLLLGGSVLGRDTALLRDSRSLALLERFESSAGSRAPRPAPGDVAAPAPD